MPPRRALCSLWIPFVVAGALPRAASVHAQEPPLSAKTGSARIGAASPWAWRLGVGAGYVAGRTTTDYSHPDPQVPRTGRFAGAAAEVTATLMYRSTPTFFVGGALGGAYAPDLGSSARVEWTWINTLMLGRASAIVGWSPGAGPLTLELGLGLAAGRFGGSQAGIADPNARFDLKDAGGLGPQGSLGVSYLHRLGGGVRLGATLSGTATMLLGSDVHTTVWGGAGALVLQL